MHFKKCYQLFAFFIATLISSLRQWLLRSFTEQCKTFLTKKLSKAGITVNGQQDFDLQVSDNRFYLFCTLTDIISFGEAYIFGWWTCENGFEMQCRLFSSDFYCDSTTFYRRIYRIFMFWVLDLKEERKMLEFGEDHHELGIDYLETSMDSTMNYSSGYWKDAVTLEEAQTHKMKLIAEKLQLTPGQKVLDIGCGWGGLCKYLAKNHKVHAVGVDNAAQLVKRAREVCQGLNVQIFLMDYNNLEQSFDKVVSVEMYYFIPKNKRRAFFQKIYNLLPVGGLFVMQTDGVDDPKMRRLLDFEKTHVYFTGYLPSVKEIAQDAEGLFVMEDLHNIGYDYYKSMMAEWEKFEETWPKVAKSYGVAYYRLTQFSFFSSAAFYKTRKIQLWQIVFSKQGVDGGYRAPR